MQPSPCAYLCHTLSNKHYAAHLRAMRLSDTNPLMLYGRVADDPEVIDITTINTTSLHNGSNAVRQQTGAIGYGHLWKPNYKVRTPNFWSINGATNHTDHRSDSWENRQTFIPGSTATETDRTGRDYQHNLKLPVDFESFFNLSPNMMLSMDANVTYNRERGNTENHQQTFDLENPDIMTNTSDFQSRHPISQHRHRHNTRRGRHLILPPLRIAHLQLQI